jgi:hypothetical protein
MEEKERGGKEGGREKGRKRKEREEKKKKQPFLSYSYRNTKAFPSIPLTQSSSNSVLPKTS